MRTATCPNCATPTPLPPGAAPGARFHCFRCGQRLAVADAAKTQLVLPDAPPAPRAPAPPALPHRPEWCCWRCGSQGRPEKAREMCALSWALILVGLFLWPVVLVGLFLRTEWRVCPDCGAGRQVAGPSLGW